MPWPRRPLHRFRQRDVRKGESTEEGHRPPLVEVSAPSPVRGNRKSDRITSLLTPSRVTHCLLNKNQIGQCGPQGLRDLPDCDPRGKGGFPGKRNACNPDFLSCSAGVSPLLAFSSTGLERTKVAGLGPVRAEAHTA